MDSILVVEDEKNIRQNIADILEMTGYSVTTAQNGQDALLMLEGAVPSLVISDIRMPVMDGRELLLTMRQRPMYKNIPFLFLTSKAEAEDIRDGMNIGADDYIAKPFKAYELIRSVDLRLNKRKDIIAQITDREIMSVDLKQNERINDLRDKLKRLTKGHLRILKRVSQNLDSVCIAHELYLSVKTVQNHRYNMTRKMELKGQNSLLGFAVLCDNYGLIDEQLQNAIKY